MHLNYYKRTKFLLADPMDKFVVCGQLDLKVIGPE